MMDPDLKTKYERYILIAITMFGLLLLYASIRWDNIIALWVTVFLLTINGMIWIVRFVLWWDEQ